MFSNLALEDLSMILSIDAEKSISAFFNLIVKYA